LQAVAVDASVITKWFVDEPYSEQARKLRDDYVDLKFRLVVPRLARYEVLNALKYSGAFGSKELIDIAKILEDYQLVEIPPDGRYAEETIKISIEHGVTIYDASYLAVGKVRGISIFTADEKLLERIKEDAFVKHIRDYQTSASMS
jgi:predicted nucleic acid-binding protein